MNHLEEAILDIIKKHYKRIYNGGIEVKKLLSGYKVILDLGNPDKRVILICVDVDSEEKFLKFIEKELIDRLLHRVHFYKGIVNYPEDEQRGINCKN